VNIVLMGPPGAGKGTQADFMKAEFSLPHISTGDIFREAVSQGTELGKKAQEYMNAGKLVPDELTIAIVEERLARKDCLQGFLLDGFPRTTVQAEALKRVLQKTGRKVEAAINISVPQDILIARLSGRISCKECKTVYNTSYSPPTRPGICDKCGGELIQRSDDRGETVKNRLLVYQEQTSPLLDYYDKHKVLYNIDGNRDSREVFYEIKEILQGL